MTGSQGSNQEFDVSTPDGLVWSACSKPLLEVLGGPFQLQPRPYRAATDEGVLTDLENAGSKIGAQIRRELHQSMLRTRPKSCEVGPSAESGMAPCPLSNPPLIGRKMKMKAKPTLLPTWLGDGRLEDSMDTLACETKAPPETAGSRQASYRARWPRSRADISETSLQASCTMDTSTPGTRVTVHGQQPSRPDPGTSLRVTHLPYEVCTEVDWAGGDATPSLRPHDDRTADQWPYDVKEPDQRSCDARKPDQMSYDARTTDQRSCDTKTPDQRSRDARTPDQRSYYDVRTPDQRSRDAMTPDQRSYDVRSPDQTSCGSRTPEQMWLDSRTLNQDGCNAPQSVLQAHFEKMYTEAFSGHEDASISTDHFHVIASTNDKNSSNISKPQTTWHFPNSSSSSDHLPRDLDYLNAESDLNKETYGGICHYLEIASARERQYRDLWESYGTSHGTKTRARKWTHCGTDGIPRNRLKSTSSIAKADAQVTSRDSPRSQTGSDTSSELQYLRQLYGSEAYSRTEEGTSDIMSTDRMTCNTVHGEHLCEDRMCARSHGSRARDTATTTQPVAKRLDACQHGAKRGWNVSEAPAAQGNEDILRSELANAIESFTSANGTQHSTPVPSLTPQELCGEDPPKEREKLVGQDANQKPNPNNVNSSDDVVCTPLHTFHNYGHVTDTPLEQEILGNASTREGCTLPEASRREGDLEKLKSQKQDPAALSRPSGMQQDFLLTHDALTTQSHVTDTFNGKGQTCASTAPITSAITAGLTKFDVSDKSATSITLATSDVTAICATSATSTIVTADVTSTLAATYVTSATPTVVAVHATSTKAATNTTDATTTVVAAHSTTATSTIAATYDTPTSSIIAGIEITPATFTTVATSPIAATHATLATSSTVATSSIEATHSTLATSTTVATSSIATTQATHATSAKVATVSKCATLATLIRLTTSATPTSPSTSTILTTHITSAASTTSATELETLATSSTLATLATLATPTTSPTVTTLATTLATAAKSTLPTTSAPFATFTTSTEPTSPDTFVITTASTRPATPYTYTSPTTHVTPAILATLTTFATPTAPTALATSATHATPEKRKKMVTFATCDESFSQAPDIFGKPIRGSVMNALSAVRAKATADKVATPSIAAKVLTPATQDKLPIISTEEKPPVLTTEEKPPVLATEEKTPILATREIAPLSTTQATSQILDTQATSQVPATPAKSKIPATQATSQIPATQGTSQIPATKATSQISATQAKSQIPATQAKSQIPATQTKSQIPATQATYEIPATQAKSQIPATRAASQIPKAQAKSQISATQAKSQIPATQAKSQIPATQAKSQISATRGKSQIPTTQAKSLMPATQAKCQMPETQAKSQIPATQAKSQILATHSKTQMSATQAKSHIPETQENSPVSATQVKPPLEDTQVKAPILTAQEQSPALAIQSKPLVPAGQAKRPVSTTQTKPPVSATQVKPSGPATQVKSSVPATQVKFSVSATQVKSSISATQVKSSVPGSQTKPQAPATQVEPSVLDTCATQAKSPVVATQSRPPKPSTQDTLLIPATEDAHLVPTTRAEFPETTEAKPQVAVSCVQLTVQATQANMQVSPSQDKHIVPAKQAKPSVPASKEESTIQNGIPTSYSTHISSAIPPKEVECFSTKDTSATQVGGMSQGVHMCAAQDVYMSATHVGRPTSATGTQLSRKVTIATLPTASKPARCPTSASQTEPTVSATPAITTISARSVSPAVTISAISIKPPPPASSTSKLAVSATKQQVMSASGLRSLLSTSLTSCSPTPLVAPRALTLAVADRVGTSPMSATLARISTPSTTQTRPTQSASRVSLFQATAPNTSSPSTASKESGHAIAAEPANSNLQIESTISDTSSARSARRSSTLSVNRFEPPASLRSSCVPYPKPRASSPSTRTSRDIPDEGAKCTDPGVTISLGLTKDTHAKTIVDTNTKIATKTKQSLDSKKSLTKNGNGHKQEDVKENIRAEKRADVEPNSKVTANVKGGGKTHIGSQGDTKLMTGRSSVLKVDIKNPSKCGNNVTSRVYKKVDTKTSSKTNKAGDKLNNSTYNRGHSKPEIKTRGRKLKVKVNAGQCRETVVNTRAKTMPKGDAKTKFNEKTKAQGRAHTQTPGTRTFGNKSETGLKVGEGAGSKRKPGANTEEKTPQNNHPGFVEVIEYHWIPRELETDDMKEGVTIMERCAIKRLVPCPTNKEPGVKQPLPPPGPPPGPRADIILRNMRNIYGTRARWRAIVDKERVPCSTVDMIRQAETSIQQERLIKSQNGKRRGYSPLPTNKVSEDSDPTKPPQHDRYLQLQEIRKLYRGFARSGEANKTSYNVNSAKQLKHPSKDKQLYERLSFYFSNLSQPKHESTMINASQRVSSPQRANPTCESKFQSPNCTNCVGSNFLLVESEPDLDEPNRQPCIDDSYAAGTTTSQPHKPGYDVEGKVWTCTAQPQVMMSEKCRAYCGVGNEKTTDTLPPSKTETDPGVKCKVALATAHTAFENGDDFNISSVGNVWMHVRKKRTRKGEPGEFQAPAEQRSIDSSHTKIVDKTEDDTSHVSVAQQRSIDSSHKEATDNIQDDTSYLPVAQQRSIDSFHKEATGQIKVDTSHLLVAQQRSIDSSLMKAADKIQAHSSQLSVAQQHPIDSFSANENVILRECHHVEADKEKLTQTRNAPASMCTNDHRVTEVRKNYQPDSEVLRSDQRDPGKFKNGDNDSNCFVFKGSSAIRKSALGESSGHTDSKKPQREHPDSSTYQSNQIGPTMPQSINMDSSMHQRIFMDSAKHQRGQMNLIKPQGGQTNSTLAQSCQTNSAEQQSGQRDSTLQQSCHVGSEMPQSLQTDLEKYHIKHTDSEVRESIFGDSDVNYHLGTKTVQYGHGDKERHDINNPNSDVNHDGRGDSERYLGQHRGSNIYGTLGGDDGELHRETNSGTRKIYQKYSRRYKSANRNGGTRNADECQGEEKNCKVYKPNSRKAAWHQGEVKNADLYQSVLENLDVNASCLSVEDDLHGFGDSETHPRRCGNSRVGGESHVRPSSSRSSGADGQFCMYVDQVQPGCITQKSITPRFDPSLQSCCPPMGVQSSSSCRVGPTATVLKASHPKRQSFPRQKQCLTKSRVGDKPCHMQPDDDFTCYGSVKTSYVASATPSESESPPTPRKFSVLSPSILDMNNALSQHTFYANSYKYPFGPTTLRCFMGSTHIESLSKGRVSSNKRRATTRCSVAFSTTHDKPRTRPSTAINEAAVKYGLDEIYPAGAVSLSGPDGGADTCWDKIRAKSVSPSYGREFPHSKTRSQFLRLLCGEFESDMDPMDVV